MAQYRRRAYTAWRLDEAKRLTAMTGERRPLEADRDARVAVHGLSCICRICTRRAAIPRV
jgi:hypothetical protein